MKTFTQLREQQLVDIIETDDDEWIVEYPEKLELDDILEIYDDQGEVIGELEIIENIASDELKDISRAVVRYNTASVAKYRAIGGGNRKEKGLQAFKTQLKGRARSAANVMTFGVAYKQQVEKGKSNFSRSFSGSIDNAKRAERGWSPKDARIAKES